MASTKSRDQRTKRSGIAMVIDDQETPGRTRFAIAAIAAPKIVLCIAEESKRGRQVEFSDIDILARQIGPQETGPGTFRSSFGEHRFREVDANRFADERRHDCRDSPVPHAKSRYRPPPCTRSGTIWRRWEASQRAI